MSSLFSSPQQVSVPVWHTGPAGFALISKVSLSQSSFMETTFRKFPLSSPFVHRRFLVRLKKVTLPVSTVLYDGGDQPVHFFEIQIHFPIFLLLYYPCCIELV